MTTDGYGFGEQADAARLAHTLTLAGLDAEPYYSGGGIMVVNVITRRGDPRPVTRLGKPTGETYAEPLDYLTIGDGTGPEPFGYDVTIGGEFAEESAYVEGIRADDAPAIAAWLNANLARVITEAVHEDCGAPNGWHLDADHAPDTRDGLGCALYEFVPDWPGITRGGIGEPVRILRPDGDA